MLYSQSHTLLHWLNSDELNSDEAIKLDNSHELSSLIFLEIKKYVAKIAIGWSHKCCFKGSGKYSNSVPD